MDAKYRFYEVVQIADNCDRLKQLAGLEGAVMGMAQDEDGSWGYAVFIYQLGESWHVLEAELQPTGRMDRRESFYDGTPVVVIWHP